MYTYSLKLLQFVFNCLRGNMFYVYFVGYVYFTFKQGDKQIC